MFDEGYPNKIFDVFLLNDSIKLKEFHLFENIWRETLLLARLHKQGLNVSMPVLSFGQLPDRVIYREIIEINGKNLHEYIEQTRLHFKSPNQYV